MPIKQHPLQALANYLPEGSFEKVVGYLNFYKVHLTVTQKRATILGNYHKPHLSNLHKITVNGNLNKYEFLITLLHELAHLITYETNKKNIEPHGKEWKTIYSGLLKEYLDYKIFPADIATALLKTIENPAATANGEKALLAVVRKYNENNKKGLVLIQEVPNGAIFQLENGRKFRKIGLRRKNYTCVELQSQKLYLFSALAEVVLCPE